MVYQQVRGQGHRNITSNLLLRVNYLRRLN